MGTFASVLVVTSGMGTGPAWPARHGLTTPQAPSRERTQTRLESDNRESTATTECRLRSLAKT